MNEYATRLVRVTVDALSKEQLQELYERFVNTGLVYKLETLEDKNLAFTAVYNQWYYSLPQICKSWLIEHPESNFKLHVELAENESDTFFFHKLILGNYWGMQP